MKNLVQQYQPQRLLLATAIGLSVSAPLFADTALEEVVVTAERRQADVQDIPISMTALSGSQLEKKAVTKLDDLQFASPSLSITDAGLTQSINIRGIGLASPNPSVTNGVATYVDGLFQPPIVSTNSFYDISDVQVLRGPQGTFAGANSTGGAIFINTKRPEPGEEINGYVKVGAANYNETSAEGAISLPISETLAIRAAFNKQDRDSFYDSIGPVKTEAGSLDETSGRLGITWEPTDALTIFAKYDFAEKESGGYAYNPIETTTFSAGRTSDIRDLDYDSETQNDEKAKAALLDARYELSNGIVFKWVTGDQTKEVENLYDNDGTSLPGGTATEQNITEDQISHEFNIISPEGESFEWVVGGYYQNNDVAVEIIGNPGVTVIADTEKTTQGIFGQIGFSATESMQVKFGMRKAWFESENKPGDGVFLPNGFKVANIDGDYKDDSLLGKLSVDWAINENHMLYAFVAKGYKPGGVNSAESTFDGEEVWSYEAGLKSSFMDNRVKTSASLFYNDYEGFQNTAVDLTTGRSNVFNIAEATIQGIELSAEAQFGGLRLDAGLSYVDSELSPTQALVNTRELPGTNLGPQCASGVPSNPPTCFNYNPYLLDTSAGPNLYAPELSFTAGIEYAFSVFGHATLTPRLNYAWIDEQWTNLIYNKTTDHLDSRGLLSAMITFEMDNWVVSAYGRNLADKEYVTGQEQGRNVEFYGAPRQYGIDVSYNF